MSGFLRARHVIISGSFKGQIDCAILEIIKEGQVHGQVHTRNLRVESGSHFSGTSYEYGDKRFATTYSKETQGELQAFLSNRLYEEKQNNKEDNKQNEPSLIEGLKKDDASKPKLNG